MQGNLIFFQTPISSLLYLSIEIFSEGSSRFSQKQIMFCQVSATLGFSKITFMAKLQKCQDLQFSLVEYKWVILEKVASAAGKQGYSAQLFIFLRLTRFTRRSSQVLRIFALLINFLAMTSPKHELSLLISTFLLTAKCRRLALFILPFLSLFGTS